MKKTLPIFLALILLVVLTLPKHSYADPRSEVLGDSTVNSDVLFPPVTAGPGYLLPDSPLYFLDKLSQKLKLAIAFSPERKAFIESQIVGERLAELRIMHARGNSQGVNIALSEIEKEATKMGQNLKDAAASGADITVLAKQLNDSLKNDRNILAAASQNAPEDLALKLQSTNQSLLVSKVNVEDFLNAADQEDAIQSDLNDEVDSAVLGIATSSEKLEKRVERLENRASRAAELEQKRADVKAQIEAKKDEAKKFLEKRKEIEAKRKALLEERKKKLEAMRESVKNAREALKNYKDARKAEKELQVTPTGTTTGPVTQ